MKRDPVLQEYLDKLANGEALDSGPFNPDVDTARRLANARPAFEPRPGFVSASRRRVLARLPAARARHARLGWRWTAASGWRSPALQGALIVLLAFMVFLSGNRLVSAAPGWLPGDLLYPLKPLAEDAALLASFSPENDADLHIQYANRRLAEIQTLALEGRYDLIAPAVAGFDRHVTDALVTVSQVSVEQPGSAVRLALYLDQTLADQVGTVSVLSGVVPGAAQGELARLLAIAVESMHAVRFIVPLDSGLPGRPGAWLGQWG